MDEQEKEYNILCQRDGENRTAAYIQELLQDLVQAEEDDNGNDNGNDKHVENTEIVEKVVFFACEFDV